MDSSTTHRTSNRFWRRTDLDDREKRLLDYFWVRWARVRDIYPRETTISEEINIPRRSLQRLISSLSTRGFLLIRARRHKPEKLGERSFMTNVYVLTPQAISALTGEDP